MDDTEAGRPMAEIPTDSRPSEEEASPEASSLAESLQSWRENLIRRVLRVLVIVGPLPIAVGSYYAYTSQDPWLIPLYLAAYGALLLVTFWQRTPYLIRVAVLLSLIYGLGILEFIEEGRGGTGRIFLLTFPILAITFLGRREGFAALAISILTMLGFGAAYYNGVLSIPAERETSSTNMIGWVSNAFVLLLMGVLLIFSANYLILRFAAALSRRQKLSRQLETEREALEQTVRERTHDLQEANYALQRRALLLEASAKVGQAITSIFDVEKILKQTVELIHRHFDFYHVGIFLINQSGQWAILKEATGEVGSLMKAQGHRLHVGETSMVGWTAKHREPRIALDATEDEFRFAHPLLPYTRSEMTLPLMFGERLLGVLDVQSTEEDAFDEDDVRALQGMADQIAVALENARRISQEGALLEATSPMYRAARNLAQASSIEDIADAIIQSVKEGGGDGCIVALFEPPESPEPNMINFVGTWGRSQPFPIKSGTRIPVSLSHLPLDALRNLWVVEDVEESPDFLSMSNAFFEQANVQAAVNVPLWVGDQQVGFIGIYSTTPTSFSQSTIRLYEAIGDQAAVALGRARLLEISRRRAKEESTLRTIGDRLARAVDVETVIRSTAQELGGILNASGTRFELGPASPTSEDPSASEDSGRVR